jgi:hypothetical protein
MRRLVLALLVVLVVTGCGSDSTAERKRFLAQANGICDHFSALQNQVQFPSVNPVAAATTHAARAEWAVALKQVAYLGAQEVVALRKLEAPESLRGRFRVMLAAKNAAYTTLLAGADAAKRNHVAEIAPTVRAGRAKLAHSDRLARALALPRCG